MIPNLDQYVSDDQDISELASNIIKFSIAAYSKAVAANDADMRELIEPIWAWARQIERITDGKRE